MSEESRRIWTFRLDKFCAISGGLIPVGIVIGNICFESIIGLVGLCWIIRSIVAKENPLRQIIKHPLVIPWIVWFASIVISLLINGPGSKGWAHDFVFIRHLLFVMALLDISQRLPVFKYLLYGLAAGIIWAAVNTISAYAFGYDILGKPLIRYTGKLKEASRISGITAYASSFFIVWGIFDKSLSNKKKSIIIGIGLVALILVFQTHVRTAILASLAGILFCVTCSFRRRISPAMALTVILLFIFAVVVFFQVKGMWSLFSVYDRIYFWKVALAMWLDHPLFGVGVSSFQDAYREMAASGAIAEYIAPDGRVFKLAEACHAHNLILMLISSTGLFGLVAFSWLFINSVRLVMKNTNGFRVGLISCPVVLLVIGITGFNIYHSWYQALLAYLMVLIGSNMEMMVKDSYE